MPERFWAKAEKMASGCWEWRASVFKQTGYGQFVVGVGKRETAHRMAWTLANGPIPEGQWVLHKCDNRLCCNPEHLFLGDAAANNRDMATKGRHVGSRGHKHSDLTRQRMRIAAALGAGAWK